MESRTWDNWPWFLLMLVLGAGVIGLIAVAAQPSGDYYRMMGGASWAWAGLMMVGLGLAVLVFAFVLIGILRQPNASVVHWDPSLGRRGPMEILDDRYARGELSREEYLKVRGDLIREGSVP